MNAKVAMRNKIKDELIRRFKASKANSGSIVITMKIDNVSLIITPSWCRSLYRTIEYADSFGVYVDVPEGRAALPYLCASSIDELASNIMNYSGVDFQNADDDIVRLMNMAADFVAEYDMYDEQIRSEIIAMQNPKVEEFIHEGFEEDMDDVALLYSYM